MCIVLGDFFCVLLFPCLSFVGAFLGTAAVFVTVGQSLAPRSMSRSHFRYSYEP